MTSVPAVSHNAAASQFEARTEHGLAKLKYLKRGNVLDLVHTEVPPEAEGKGIGGSLARAALEHARSEGVKVVPSCPFVRDYLTKHQEFSNVVAAR